MEVLRGDRRRDRRRRIATKSAASVVVICSKTIFSSGKSRDQRRQHALDEHRLAVENIDLWVGDFAMDAQHHADRLHLLQRRVMLRMSVTPLALLVVAPAG